MATEWSLQSCQCKIKITKNEQGNLELVKWIQKCALHKDVIDEQLLDTLLTHDRQWNASLTGTSKEMNIELSTLKSAEYSRIKKLGNVEKNANFHPKRR